MHFLYDPAHKNETGVISPADLNSIERSSCANKEEKALRTTLPTGKINDDLGCKLFDNRSNLKQIISKIAMHMRDEIRKDFFKQIDELLDIEEFTEDDSLINVQSFSTFLNFFSLVPNLKRVALTVAPSGNTVASWITSDEKLHVQFLPSGCSQTIISLIRNEENEVRTHQGSLDSLVEFLNDNKIMCWKN